MRQAVLCLGVVEPCSTTTTLTVAALNTVTGQLHLLQEEVTKECLVAFLIALVAVENRRVF